jgi:hypothetical protein
MAYSWPHLSAGLQARTVTVDNHLAHSDDDGRHWALNGPLWTSAAEVDAVTGASAFVNNEVVTLEAAKQAGTVTWYSARERYDTAAVKYRTDGREHASVEVGLNRPIPAALVGELVHQHRQLHGRQRPRPARRARPTPAAR